ncbi:hypothetical protein AGIG_G11155 [Arapaima gigas]
MEKSAAVAKTPARSLLASVPQMRRGLRGFGSIVRHEELLHLPLQQRFSCPRSPQRPFFVTNHRYNLFQSENRTTGTSSHWNFPSSGSLSLRLCSSFTAHLHPPTTLRHSELPPSVLVLHSHLSVTSSDLCRGSRRAGFDCLTARARGIRSVTPRRFCY